MKNSSVNYMVVVVFLLGLAACNTSDDNAAGPSVSDPSDGTGGTVAVTKVYLDAATLQQIAQHSGTCGNKICVEVCHRPPGNPDNCHTKRLPLQATSAHLHHGGGHHSEKDYLGPCVLTPGQEDDPPVSTDPSTDPTDPGAGGDPGDTPTGEIPFWCAPYIEIDSDCDGFIDGTSDPLL